MMIEKSIEEFQSLIRNNDFFRDGDTLAFGLLIPAGKLNNLVKTDKEKDLIISEGVKILSHLKDGLFVRIGWTDYCGFTQGEPEQIKEILENAIKQSSLVNENFGLWQATVARLGNYDAGMFLRDLAMPIEKSYRPISKNKPN